MPESLEIAVSGATIRRIIDAAGWGSCMMGSCSKLATWAVYREHYDSFDDDEWRACDAHLSQVAVDAINFDEDDDDDDD